MRIIIFIIALSFSTTCFAQQVTWKQWEQESKTNIRLLPKYGSVEKTEAQIKSDEAFIERILEQDSTHRKGADHLIDLGFEYLYRDVKTAMYRFNQAYLLDSTNTDIYWGYGAVYMRLGHFAKAKEQYETGLKIDPKNTRILTDYGTYYMGQYYNLYATDENSALKQLDTAISYLEESYDIDPSNADTIFKLSTLYWNKGECDKAWEFYDLSMNGGGQLITDLYTKDLQEKCPRE